VLLLGWRYRYCTYLRSSLVDETRPIRATENFSLKCIGPEKKELEYRSCSILLYSMDTGTIQKHAKQINNNVSDHDQHFDARHVMHVLYGYVCTYTNMYCMLYVLYGYVCTYTKHRLPTVPWYLRLD
jgi:hypothetical protein